MPLLLVELGLFPRRVTAFASLARVSLKAKKLELHAAGASKAAVAAVETAGGKIVLPAPSSEQD
jgi:large subunit ribosomal protein L15